jgi:ubiquinone/menaquinone biosynthesis C-methylase UbiE
MDVERQVAAHYARGGLEAAILDALMKAGKRVDPVDPADLAAVDEFHFGWAAVTEELCKDAGFAPEMHVLDIGAGIGGPARHFARACGCRVTGVDLTEEFVAAANALTRRCGLADRVSIQTGSALALPFRDAGFDGATLMHVGMNIADKVRLFSEARRVLKPGGVFVVYDVMRTDKGELPYPMPWAASAETSFVETPDVYRTLLEGARFRVEVEKNRRDFALALMAEARAKAEKEGASPLGIHVLVGPATPERMGNAFSSAERGLIAPIEMIARAV